MIEERGGVKYFTWDTPEEAELNRKLRGIEELIRAAMTHEARGEVTPEFVQNAVEIFAQINGLFGYGTFRLEAASEEAVAQMQGATP